MTEVQIAEVGKCHKFEFEIKKPPFECEANAPNIFSLPEVNPHKSKLFSEITPFSKRGTYKMGQQGWRRGGRRGVNSGGTGCQVVVADHAGIEVLGFHSLLRGRMGIFGGGWHRPLSLQPLNTSLQFANIFSEGTYFVILFF